MKRYSICDKVVYNIGSPNNIIGTEMVANSEGEWVKYESVLDLLGKNMVCNCERKSERDYEVNWWICPAHGYKSIK